jgi:hypothetical protein
MLNVRCWTFTLISGKPEQTQWLGGPHHLRVVISDLIVSEPADHRKSQITNWKSQIPFEKFTPRGAKRRFALHEAELHATASSSHIPEMIHDENLSLSS